MTKIIRIDQHGGPEVMKYLDVDIGKPGPGQVRLRHTAIGLNYIDTYHRTGLYKIPIPYTLGGEAAGVVEEVGPGVTELKPGDRVGYGSLAGGGGYSEARLAPADRLIKLPDSIDDKTAASILLKGHTVEALLLRCFPVKPGHTILLHAAAGGVGLILAQWAASLGATVIGTAGSAEKVALAKVNGVTQGINYRTENFVERVKEITGGKGCEAVFDSVGKDTFLGSLDCLKRRGYLVAFGNASGVPPPLDVGLLAAKGSLFVTRMSSTNYLVTREELVASAKALFDVIARGVVKVRPSQEFPLAEAAEAHRALEGRKTTGSTILIP